MKISSSTYFAIESLVRLAVHDANLLFLEGVSLADIAPAADEASPDHTGHKVH